MVAIPGEVMDTLRKFLNLIAKDGIRLEKAILFGSYAKGNPGKWSDLDIALVSKDFSGIRFYDCKKINPFIIKVDSRIEPHPFKSEDFTRDNPFVDQILKDGIEIALDY
ncbi:MAG: nucleotidyltransferase domain-containing protein [Candidatus Scalindua sp.]